MGLRYPTTVREIRLRRGLRSCTYTIRTILKRIIRVSVALAGTVWHQHETARRVDDGYELMPWSGYWRNYETRNGMTVPTEGEVVWYLPDGDVHAWQGRVTDIQYDELLSCRGRNR
ncbi:DUF6920 family protein [Natrinema pellirubrum]|uniref:DUF6920 family protein n=1 Tax=Natrinema pellirubrum TaxID=69525 RepID=UPI00022DAB46